MIGRQTLRRAGLALAVLTGATLLAGCGAGPAEPVAPTPAPSTEYPFFAQVRSATLGYLCGGALIAPSWVLTAARCVTDGLSVIIGGGALDDEKGGEVRAVAEARLHPSWTSTTVGFDAALLHLAGPSTLTPVRLADSLAPGAAVRAIGHALVEGASNSGQLRQVDLRAAPLTELTREYGAGFDPATMLGAGVAAGQQPFCAGDRGSPLLVGSGTDGESYRLVGVTSRERGCPPLARPGLFASVVSGPVRGWIETHVPRQVAGFALADRPTAASYDPEVSGGGTHTVARGGVGAYTVSFAGLGHGVVDGLAQVTAYGSTEAVCQVAGAAPVGSAQEVRVRCTGPRNEPVDAAFSASYARPGDVGPYAAALVSGADLQSVYNSGGGDNTVRRNGTGDHTVTLPAVASDRGAVMITPYGDRPATCAVTQDGGDQLVRVRCFAPFSSSTPVDTAFALGYTDGPPPAPLAGGRWAWVLARPDAPAGGFNSAGGDNTVTRTAAGTYRVSLGRLGPRRGIVHVTTVDQRSQRCTPGDLAAEDDAVTITVRCAADTAFTLLFQS